MNVPFAQLIVALSALTLITVALAVPGICLRIVGSSNLRNALIPLVTAGVIGATAFTADLLKGRIEQETVPEDNLTIYIQKVDFGVAPIPDDYTDHAYSTPEVKRFRARWDVDEDLHFTDEERSRLDQLANSSAQIDTLSSDQAINTRELAQTVGPLLRFYFNYGKWSNVSLSWANLIDEGHAVKDEDKVALLKKLIDAVNSQKNAGGLFQAIVGMAWRRMISLQPAQGDCSASSLGLVNGTESEGTLYLSFPTFLTPIASANAESEQKERAEDLTRDFQRGCLVTLSQIFRNASPIFTNEVAAIDKYVKELNRILAAKQPESIRISVSISNIGQFNSFVRNSAKVAVGPKGPGEKLSFVIHSVATESDSENSTDESSGYIQVNSRSTKPVIFYSPLSADLQAKIYGAYESQQAYLRLGIVASAGANEGTILSQVAPFSSQTQEEFSRRVDEMKITF